jgi:hypothetical protein
MADSKLVIAVFDQGTEPDVMEVLTDLGIRHYTRISNASGSGETGRREGNPIWPGLNTVLLIVMPAEQVQPTIERLHAVRDSYPITPGMRFIVTDAEII